MSAALEFGTEPTTPPPDPNMPYLWIGGQWVLLTMDTTDDVPESLDDLDEDNNRSYIRADATPCKTPVYDISKGPGGNVLCEVCGNTRAAHKRGGTRHLPGQHNQKSHGHGGGGTKAAHASLSDEQAAGLITKLQEPDGGFTINPRTGEAVTSGYAVAMFPERSKEVAVRDVTAADLKSYVDNNRSVLDTDGNMFGAWHDPETGIAWLDVSRVTAGKETAIALAKKQNQIAIFDFSTFESVPTGGTGRSLFIYAETRAGLMSTVERKVHLIGASCKRCAANTDPYKVPVHPGCNCDVVTESVDVGVDPEHLRVLEDWISRNLPVDQHVRMIPGTTSVLPMDDLRFGDLAKWLEMAGGFLDTAEVITIITDDDESLQAALEAAVVGGTITPAPDSGIARRRLWLGLGSVVGGPV